jgi:rhamnogalacturonyl hydrolase YesR
VYMVPPFLAYYGVTTLNVTLLQEAYTQISLYRKYLRDQNANNLWKHIQLGSYGTDNGHWSTGDLPCPVTFESSTY